MGITRAYCSINIPVDATTEMVIATILNKGASYIDIDLFKEDNNTVLKVGAYLDKDADYPLGGCSLQEIRICKVNDDRYKRVDDEECPF